MAPRNPPEATTNGQTSGKNLKNAQPLRLRIDDQWYDLTHWQFTHPGGPDILRHLDGEDATDAFYSLHSTEAIARLKRLPKAPLQPTDKPSTPLDVSFRKLRAELEEEGFYNRNPLWEAFYMGSICSLIFLGMYIAEDHPWIAMVLMGLGMEQAGWVGHDYTHGRGKFCWYAGRAMAFFNAFSTKWWSDKHNTHHVYPNHIGVDHDIQNDPFIHLWYPDDDKEFFLRPYQHIYYFPLMAVLYWSWRLQSIQFVMASKDRFEIAHLVLSYAFMLYFTPLKVFIGAVSFGGWLVGIIVTATHQSEELLDPNRKPYDFVRDQFLSTRDGSSKNPLMHWLWGGMQYQLEHHLFPTMPKYYYSTIAPRLEAWAKKNKVLYRSTEIWALWKMNYDTMHEYSLPGPKKSQ